MKQAEFEQKLANDYSPQMVDTLQLMLGVYGGALAAVWRPPVRYPQLATGLERITGLTAARVVWMTQLHTPLEIVRLVIYDTRQLHAVLSIGKAVLDSPIGADMRTALLTPNVPAGEVDWHELLPQLGSMAADLIRLQEEFVPARDRPPAPDDEEPADDLIVEEEPAEEEEQEDEEEEDEDETDESRRPIPSGVELRQLREELEALLTRELKAGPVWIPDRRGPFLRRTFNELELSALRLLLTHVPTLGTLLAHPLPLALQELSGFQPAGRLADITQRLNALKPAQPIHLTLTDTITLYQALQGGALLLFSATARYLTEALRRRLRGFSETDDERRAAAGRLLLLLDDATTNQRFRQAFAPLLKSFVAAADRAYPHATALRQAREEVAALVALR